MYILHAGTTEHESSVSVIICWSDYWFLSVYIYKARELNFLKQFCVKMYKYIFRVTKCMRENSQRHTVMQIINYVATLSLFVGK